MRHTSESLLSDNRLKELFCQLADECTFNEDDVDEVYARYVARAETLIGNDVGRAFNESLHSKAAKKYGKKRPQKLEQLRSVKRKKTSESKLLNNEKLT